MSTIALVAALALQVQIFAPSAPPPENRPATTRATDTGKPGDAPAEPEVTQICRMVPVTGTRFPRRVCRSARQDRADREESQDMLRNGQGLPQLEITSNSPSSMGAAGPN